MIYTVIIFCTCGCELSLSCMHPARSPLLVVGEQGQSLGPKVCISIQYGNGPPFAACHHKIGGFVLARVPPAEWGPVFLLCSMTPLTLSVDFLSLFLGRALSALLISAFLSSSRTALGKKKNQQTTEATSHLKRFI